MFGLCKQLVGNGWEVKDTLTSGLRLIPTLDWVAVVARERERERERGGGEPARVRRECGLSGWSAWYTPTAAAFLASSTLLVLTSLLGQFVVWQRLCKGKRAAAASFGGFLLQTAKLILIIWWKEKTDVCTHARTMCHASKKTVCVCVVHKWAVASTWGINIIALVSYVSLHWLDSSFAFRIAIKIAQLPQCNLMIITLMISMSSSTTALAIIV